MIRLLAGGHHLLRQRRTALPSLGKDLAFRHAYAPAAAFLPDQSQLLRQIIREAVDRHHHRHAVLLQILDVRTQVTQAAGSGFGVRPAAGGFIAAPVVAQGAHRYHQHRRRRRQPRRGTFDIKEFFGAQVAAEARLGDGIFGQGKGQAGGPHRVAAVGDIGKGAAVHQAGGMLQRLHQVGAQRVAQQRRHGALRPQVTGKNRGPSGGIAHQNAAQPLPQIRQIPRQAQDRHDLAGHADLEAVPAGNAVGLATQPDLDLPQGTVVHIHAAAEYNPLRVQPQRIALMNVVVDEGRKQIVGGGDGVDIPGKVQVDLLHRQYLRIPAAGGAALQPEYRAQRRLPQGDHRPLAQK